MRKLMTAAAAGLVLGLAACATSGAEGVSGESPAQPYSTATVTRDGDVWVLEYKLYADAPVWAFQRSALLMDARTPWRAAQWTVETPGVTLERHGFLDVLRARDGTTVPRVVRIRMRPASANLEADYDPALVFTDGSMAVYSGHLDLFPLGSVEAARDLPLDLNGVETASSQVRATWRDRAGPVLFEGERRRDPVSGEQGVYVLFGQADLVDSPDLATVIDPQLPRWIGAEIGAFAPRVAHYYTQRLGAGQTGKPTIMVAWRGPTPHLRSMGGSVLAGLIVMSFEGEGVVERTEAVGDSARWFIGHESAHFWLGQTVRYELSRDAWITEGGADLMAIRALAAIDPAYDARAELQQEIDTCALWADEPVVSANTRGEHKAYYGCGAVFALAAEAAQRRRTGGDWFDFLKPLIDANREDGVLTRDEWLDALDAVSGDPELRREMEALLDNGAPDPHSVIARLFDRSGVAYRLEAGKVRLS
jgi:hypothetical protein